MLNIVLIIRFFLQIPQIKDLHEHICCLYKKAPIINENLLSDHHIFLHLSVIPPILIHIQVLSRTFQERLQYDSHFQEPVFHLQIHDPCLQQIAKGHQRLLCR